ncbi:hypothetical protein, partial [Microvirga sesbaniae]|uniref:hypothetical protein n=1 Tax=Microvirga sesbaniae TaxID=681392 RepID=UPI0021C6A960
FADHLGHRCAAFHLAQGKGDLFSTWRRAKAICSSVYRDLFMALTLLKDQNARKSCPRNGPV